MLLDIDHIEPERIAAIDSEGQCVSYGEIRELTRLISETVRPRSLVFILSHNEAGALAWVAAVIASGNVPLILSANTDKSLLSNLYDTYKPQYICRKSDDGEGEYPVLAKYGYGISPTFEPAYDLHPELSHLLPTSGTTGSPKLVRHKYENIESSALNISTFFQLNRNSRPLMVLPLHYTMGLSIVFSHLKVGATILITGLSMTDPLFWKFFKEQEATSFTGVPFSYEILDKMRFTRMTLPHLELLTQGGGKMPEGLNIKFAEYCRENGKRWIATYGMSEGTARMAWLPPQYALSKVGSIGIAVPNGELWLRDSEGEIIEESPATGELCYRGKNVTMGYAESAADLVKGDELHGELATGDIAYRDADGFYYIKGRLGRFVKIYGLRISLEECERIVNDAIEGSCACTGSDSEIKVYVTDFSNQQQALKALTTTTHLPADIFEIKVIDRLPKNEAGKIMYSKLL